MGSRVRIPPRSPMKSNTYWKFVGLPKPSALALCGQIDCRDQLATGEGLPMKDSQKARIESKAASVGRRPIGAVAQVASARSSRRHFGRTFKRRRALRLLTPGGDSKPEGWLCAISLWTLREGSSGGGRPDFPARPKSIASKSSNSNGSPRPTKAKEKPAGLRRRASCKQFRTQLPQLPAPGRLPLTSMFVSMVSP
jgi:hypothetical protein